MDDELAALAEAHGVATCYEDAGQRWVDVDPSVVVAVLAQLDVDASTPEAVRAALAVATDAPDALPATIVVRSGKVLDLGHPATVVLEDGGEVELPAELPMGYHRIGATTVIVTPDRLPSVPRAWGWMVQLYALRSRESWGMGDYADLATIARRSSVELNAGVLLVNPVQAISPTHPVERSPYSPASRRYQNPIYLRVTATAAYADADQATRAAIADLRPDNTTELIDYDAVWTAKAAALELLWPFHRERVDLDTDPAL
ncbi:MAG TPA: 4-alpha-glucanotransferase, partial [Umezawaea sp.]|nr:4-alpha-glucanotransferase [Umezawaea sp.]